MKKVYTTIILFVSLFFFCSHNVSAYTYNLTFSENELNLINEDFLNFKNLVIEKAEELGKQYYFMRYKDNKYDVVFFNNPYNQTTIDQTSYRRILITDTTNSGQILLYKYQNNELISSGTYSSASADFKQDNTYIYLATYLYSNINIINTMDHIYNLSYGDYSYSFGPNNEILGLYEHYLNINGLTDEDFQPDIHKEEKTILSNFYTLVIEKINLLANSIINNYIYLTVIGIFILIFVICLIRRYLL